MLHLISILVAFHFFSFLLLFIFVLVSIMLLSFDTNTGLGSWYIFPLPSRPRRWRKWAAGPNWTHSGFRGCAPPWWVHSSESLWKGDFLLLVDEKGVWTFMFLDCKKIMWPRKKNWKNKFHLTLMFCSRKKSKKEEKIIDILIVW